MLQLRALTATSRAAWVAGQEESSMSAAEAPGRLHLGYGLDAGVAVVTVTGEVDLVTCGVFRDGLLRTVTDDNGRGLGVNLAEVSFLDSTGLAVLAGVWHRVEASGGRRAVGAPSRQVRGALNTAGLTKALSVYGLEADAVRACGHPAAG